jgi:hypothetical protein
VGASTTRSPSAVNTLLVYDLFRRRDVETSPRAIITVALRLASGVSGALRRRFQFPSYFRVESKRCVFLRGLGARAEVPTAIRPISTIKLAHIRRWVIKRGRYRPVAGAVSLNPSRYHIHVLNSMRQVKCASGLVITKLEPVALLRVPGPTSASKPRRGDFARAAKQDNRAASSGCAYSPQCWTSLQILVAAGGGIVIGDSMVFACTGRDVARAQGRPYFPDGYKRTFSCYDQHR